MPALLPSVCDLFNDLFAAQNGVHARSQPTSAGSTESIAIGTHSRLDISTTGANVVLIDRLVADKRDSALLPHLGTAATLCLIAAGVDFGTQRYELQSLNDGGQFWWGLGFIPSIAALEFIGLSLASQRPKPEYASLVERNLVTYGSMLAKFGERSMDGLIAFAKGAEEWNGLKLANTFAGALLRHEIPMCLDARNLSKCQKKAETYFPAIAPLFTR